MGVFLCVGLYVLGLSMVFSIRTVSRGVVEAGKFGDVFLTNLMAGLRYMYHHRLVLSIVLLVVAHCGMTMSFESLFPVLSRDNLGMEDGAGIMSSASYLMVGYGAAALVTSLFLAGVQSEQYRGRVGSLAWYPQRRYTVSSRVCTKLGVGRACHCRNGSFQGGFMTLSHAMLQTIAPDAIRGRLMGVYSWHTQGFMASFNLVNGTLAGFTALTAPIILAAVGWGS